MPRTTPLLGLKAPTVKPGEITLPVLVGAGDWHELSAPPRVWRQIIDTIAPLLPPVPVAEPRQLVVKPCPRRLR